MKVYYDGDCNFCSFWIQKWQIKYPKFEYLPINDINSVECHIDGKIYQGAGAVFKIREIYGKTWLWNLYSYFFPFRLLSDLGYYLIAKNRYLVSKFFGTSCKIKKH